ncbi:hypothetical protein KEM52_004253, partial [Ascosphaera acerosa]
ATPDPAASKKTTVKLPRRLRWFDGRVVRHLSVTEDAGAAVLANGDLVQWGAAFAPGLSAPQPTLVGRDLVEVSLARDRVLALARDGTVYSLPMARDAQLTGPKPHHHHHHSSSWWRPWRQPDDAPPLSYRLLQPSLLPREKVTALAAGDEHVLLLTSAGRVFAAACAGGVDAAFPARGQLGVPGLAWETRPPGAYDTCHLVEAGAPPGEKAVQVAAGARHSLVLTDAGRVLAFGDNAAGQLGREPGAPRWSAEPLEMAIPGGRSRAGAVRATAVAAGGATSFVVTEAREPAPDVASTTSPPPDTPDDTRSTRVDVWSCGGGASGALGAGRYVHAQPADAAGAS